MSVKIALISDIHAHSNFYDQIEENLQIVIDEIEDMDVDHTYILGDLILEEDKRKDIELIDKVSNQLDQSNEFQCTYLCGNHDLINISREEFLEAVGQESTSGINNHDNVPVVYLDSAVKGKVAGELSEDDIHMSQKYCEKYDNLVFLSHHPLKTYNLVGNKWFSNKPHDAVCRNYYDFYEKVDFNKILCCVSGHIHQHSKNEYLTDWYSLQVFARRTPNSYDNSIATPPVTGSYSTAELKDNNVELHQHY